MLEDNFLLVVSNVKTTSHPQQSQNQILQVKLDGEILGEYNTRILAKLITLIVINWR